MTDADLIAEVLSQLPTNGSNMINAARLRQVLIDIIESKVNAGTPAGDFIPRGGTLSGNEVFGDIAFLSEVALKGLDDLGAVIAQIILSTATGIGPLGTPSNPYSLLSVSDIVSIPDDLNASYMLKFDPDLSAIANWIPIGNGAQSFTGNFFGDKHTVHGLKINDSQDRSLAGFFGYLGIGSKVFNLFIDQPDISPVNAGSTFAGGITGINYGQIGSCAVLGGSITAKYGGGIAGINASRIDNFIATADIYAGATPATIHLGGAVGENQSGAYLTRGYAACKVLKNGQNHAVAGGLIGIAEGFVGPVYYDSQLSGLNDNRPRGGQPRTTAQLKDRSNYPSLWDFTSTWKLNTGEYPNLYSAKPIQANTELLIQSLTSHDIHLDSGRDILLNAFSKIVAGKLIEYTQDYTVLGELNLVHRKYIDRIVATLNAAIALKEDKASKDSANGYPGLSGFMLRLKNLTGTIESFLRSQATQVRIWTFPDKDITVAGIQDIQTRVSEDGALRGSQPEINIVARAGLKSSISNNLLNNRVDVILESEFTTPKTPHIVADILDSGPLKIDAAFAGAQRPQDVDSPFPHGGKAWKFTGEDLDADTPAIDAGPILITSPFYVRALIRWDGPGQQEIYQQILGEGSIFNTDSGCFFLYIDPTSHKLVFAVYADNLYRIESSTVMVSGGMYQILAWYDGDRTHLAINKTIEVSSTSGVTGLIGTGTYGRFTIGRDLYSGNYSYAAPLPFNGVIDEVKLAHGIPDLSEDPPWDSDENTLRLFHFEHDANALLIDPSALPKATDTKFGVVKLSKKSADPANPIAVETSDPRVQPELLYSLSITSLGQTAFSVPDIPLILNEVEGFLNGKAIYVWQHFSMDTLGNVTWLASDFPLRPYYELKLKFKKK